MAELNQDALKAAEEFARNRGLGNIIGVVIDTIRIYLAALPKQEPSGWRSIESAPKDGTHVVLFGTLWKDPDQRPRACLSWWCNRREDSPAYALGWFFIAPGYADGFNPTHWQPLPDPPKGAEG
ncbi:MAG TPA: hypothetical protein VE977_13870 [Pyrinomonadaceae bacterium]|nr:hypothetical protein [Pyrinomonadaceae bacterium]